MQSEGTLGEELPPRRQYRFPAIVNSGSTEQTTDALIDFFDNKARSVQDLEAGIALATVRGLLLRVVPELRGSAKHMIAMMSDEIPEGHDPFYHRLTQANQAKTNE